MCVLSIVALLLGCCSSQAAEDEMPKAEGGGQESTKQEILNLFFEKHKSALKEEGEKRQEAGQAEELQKCQNFFVRGFGKVRRCVDGREAK